jgi:hypothetical protein
VQEFMTEFRKRAIQMGVSLKSPDMLVKYLGELLPQIHRQLMLFRPKTIDEANIQAQYLEGDKQKQQTNPHKQVEPQEKQRKKKNKKKWNEKKVVETTQEGTPPIQQCKGCD